MRLIHVTDQAPGIRRRRQGTGYVYRNARGQRISSRRTLERIRAIVIPPAWSDVWICADPRGHLQATGRDAKGRKQYRYHAGWTSRRGQDKFQRIADFAKQLPKLRRRLRRDLARKGLPREKVLAVAISLMARTLIRIGNDAYLRANHSYGLSTLRARHLRFLRDGRARLKFIGKSGQSQDIALDNRRLIRLLRRCQDLPGQALFQYIDEEGRRHRIDSGMINDYLQDAIGNGFTAKDFRTWGGTQLMVAALLRQRAEEEKATPEAMVVAATKEVARALGNSPAVCRNSYIHPKVFSDWAEGNTLRRAPAELAHQPRKLERFVLKVLR